jgi:ribosomal-protein-alanine N-acetyltransferase
MNAEPIASGRVAGVIVTDRLDLVPSTIASLRAALRGRAALAAELGVYVPETWPPEYLDDVALEYTLAHLEDAPSQLGWWLYFVLLREGDSGRTLIGSVGYKGPPTPDGTVEVGYGIVADHRRRGYASECTRALVHRAFALPTVRRVIAETLPKLEGSIGVLHACGFRLIGEGSEPGVIRFELLRTTS